MSTFLIAVVVIAVILVIALTILFVLVPMGTYFRCLLSGAYIPMHVLLGMKMRKVDYKSIANAYMLIKKAGVKIPIASLEKHKIAGGDVMAVATALGYAKETKLPITIADVMTLNLAGRDVIRELRTCVQPQVLSTEWISAICRDGIEMRVKLKLTVVSSPKDIAKGVGLDSFYARINEVTIATIGQIANHATLLQNPEVIAKGLFSQNVEEGTGYEVISVDVSDVTIGANIGAKVIRDEAEKSKALKEADSAERRAVALALEQEMKARTEEMKSQILSAEAEVPKAIAEAIKEGKMDLLDYYKMQNLQADTAMRRALFEAKDEDKKEVPKKRKFNFDDFDNFGGDLS